MFDRKRPDGIAVRRIKALVSDCLQLTETTLISVMELNCHEPGCPPTETVITARYPDGSMRDWRIAKPVAQIEDEDVKAELGLN
tara:strand:- start:2079 stop:2330 length:252 start_codon:yes stop_codon:yes gene_type:complete